MNSAIDSLTRQHVAQAIAQLNSRASGAIEASETREVRHRGRAYSLNSVLQLAFAAATKLAVNVDSIPASEEESTRALTRLGFAVASIREAAPLLNERARRDAMWQRWSESLPTEGTPAMLAELGIRPVHTGQGIYRDHDRTAALAPRGVTVSMLDVGARYPDEFDDDGGIYHYPTTGRGTRDDAEIAATKNASRLAVPVFVVRAGSDRGLRELRRAWVEDWDDDARLFFVAFSSCVEFPSDAVFQLFDVGAARTRPTQSRARKGQAKFRFEVFKRYGAACALCDLAIPELLEAVRICPFAENGTNDPRNGLVLCRNHHCAFDRGLFSFDAETGRVLPSADSVSMEALHIQRPCLQHLRALPHADALHWRRRRSP